MDDLARRVLARFTAAKRPILDPGQKLETNAVAYFTVGGDERDGDPESIALHPGDVPIDVVMHQLRRRNGEGSKAQPGPKPGEVTCHATNYKGEQYSYVTKVKVEGRK
jgi:hypothetical protein